MKTPILAIAGTVSLLLTSGALEAADAPADANMQEAKKIVQEFAGRLQLELKTAMSTGGPISAVQVCERRAPAIAQGLSQSTGWDVGRTSLKVRNAKTSTPDAWEIAVLEKFEARKAAGEHVETMAYSEVVQTPEGKRFRFMKAIPTQELCLTCHGSEIPKEVAQSLDEHYPDDQARGFSVGDIRGAFSLSKPL